MELFVFFHTNAMDIGAILIVILFEPNTDL